MNTIKLSIIIPIYNSSDTLTRCIDSILTYKYKDIEVIAINDGSSDNSLDILKKIETKDSRLKVISKINGGVSSARNYGLEIASGKYIMFIDSDDWLEKDAIININHILEHNKSIDIIKFNYQKVYNDRIIKNRIDDSIEIGTILTNEKYYKCVSTVSSNSSFFNSVWGQVVRKSIIKTKFQENITYGEDFLFNINLFQNAKNIYITDKILYNYLENNSGISKNISVEMSRRKIDNLFIIYKDIIKYITSISEDDDNKNMIKMKFINELTNNTVKLFAFGNIKDIQYLKEKMEGIDKNFLSKKVLSKNSNKFAIISKLMIKKLYGCIFIFSKIIFKPMYMIRRGVKNVTSKK